MTKIVAAFSLFCLILNAQLSSAQVELGLYGGLHSLNLSGDKPSGFKYQSGPGAIFGLTLDIPVLEDVIISFQPGYVIGMTKLGYKDKEADEIRDSIDIQVNSISLPTLFKILSKNGKIHVTGGLDWRIPLSATISNGSVEEDFKDEVKIDVAFVFGVGFRIPVGSSKIVIEPRLSQGLSNLVDNRDQMASLIPRVKTRVFQVLVGWQIPLQ